TQQWQWQSGAHCRGFGYLFYGNGTETRREQSERERAAKLICAACPVIDSCYDHCMAFEELHGVWAGLSERDR
ncbi:MAG: WhiB family transcriptional regulator, partial [Rhodococcus sp.]|nr:WhiB family transcriptional regulator [Rhodococcus sp. (in: high G+C Gram-positive bacteria)]